MKKISWLFLTVALLGLLCACGNARQPADTTAATVPVPRYLATDAQIAGLENLYAGRVAYHGELHDHADTGGTSDGKATLQQWKENLMAKDMDFATFADHKQVLHMRLEDWDNTMFIGGTEAATNIIDSKAYQNNLHYNMLFAYPEQLEAVLNARPRKFAYNRDHFTYGGFSTAEFSELAQSVWDNGGFFVHVHPKGTKYMASDDPLDYYFAEGMGIEVLCGWYGGLESEVNQNAYKLWTDLLALGKRVYATSGSDSHYLSKTVSLTTIYSHAKDAEAYLNYVRSGDFTAGPVGIRMCIGDTLTGGVTAFEGKQLVVAVGDFHSQEYQPGHTYRVELIDDKGVVASKDVELNGQTQYLALEADPAASFYRAVLVDVEEDRIVAVGNPIWNEKEA